MKIYYYPFNSSTAVDLTPYIEDVDKQSRSDDAFALTTFKVRIPNTLFSEAYTNMPPFTVFEIAPDNEAVGNPNNTRYFGKSKCNKYLRVQASVTYYIHDITLIDPLALLEGVQIGSKTFSNHSDSTYFNILADLISARCGYYITFGTFTESEQHTYSYDKGATAFQIANDMCRMNNLKMVAKLTNLNTDIYHFRLDITFIDLSNIEEVAINTNYLSMVEYDQSENNYCYALESAIDNVIDRNTDTIFDNLFVKSNDNTITPDNCFIELPSKVERISKLAIYGDFTFNLEITISEAEKQALEDDTNIDTNAFNWADALTHISWLNTVASEVQELNPNFNPRMLGDTFFLGNDNAIYAEADLTRWLDISAKLLESDIYMPLTTNNQPNYCYYKSGDNKIQGIYKFYNADWIHQAIGATTNPMLSNLFDVNYQSSHQIGTDAGGSAIYSHVTFNTTLRNGTEPTRYKFKAVAKPITSQYVKDLKEDTPLNESGYSYLSRSYGNSANFIDYDIMRRNIKISNKSLGTQELTLQFYKHCNLTANSKFSYDGKMWYVMSIIMNIYRNNIVYTVNASTDYNKQANAIGVRTQFESTKIALDNIKERHIYYRNNTSIALSSNRSYYFYITMSYVDGTIKNFVVPVSFYFNASTGATLVFSCIDNFSIGTIAESIGIGDRFIHKDVSYVDSNGEVNFISKIELIHFGSELTIDECRLLPNVPTTAKTLDLEISTLDHVYKDEHEALTFTVYLPNATLN